MLQGRTAGNAPFDWPREHDAQRPGAGEAITRRPNPIERADGGFGVTNLAATQPGGRREQTILSEVSVARSLLDRGDLLQRLDRAVTKRVTVISAPAGSGKTSVLRAW